MTEPKVIGILGAGRVGTAPAAVVRAWMASPGHRANILNCRLRHLGVGVALSRGQLWWTQDFGRK